MRRNDAKYRGRPRLHYIPVMGEVGSPCCPFTEEREEEEERLERERERERVLKEEKEKREKRVKEREEKETERIKAILKKKEPVKRKAKAVGKDLKRKSPTPPTVPPNTSVTTNPPSLIPTTSLFPAPTHPTPQITQPRMPYVPKTFPVSRPPTIPAGLQPQIPLTLPTAPLALDQDAEERIAKRVADILSQRILNKSPNPSYSAITQLPAVPFPP